MAYQRLEHLRVDHDKTQEDIAKVLSCHREVYRRYEKGITSIPVWALIMLADYYNVSLDYLVGRSDDKSPFRAPDQTNRGGATT